MGFAHMHVGMSWWIYLFIGLPICRCKRDLFTSKVSNSHHQAITKILTRSIVLYAAVNSLVWLEKIEESIIGSHQPRCSFELLLQLAYTLRPD